MPVQFEEDKPFSVTGIPAEKPKALVKFLMDEGVAWTPRAAKIELGIIAVLTIAATFAVLIYKDRILNTEVEVKYDINKDPMIGLVKYSE